MNPVFVARQPIFDRLNRLSAYELLYRAHGAATFADPGVTPTTMASSVIVDAVLGLGMERLTEGRTAFFNLSEPLILAGIPEVLEPANVVLELLETVRPTPAVLAACRSLRERGFRLALDDFTYGEAYVPFLEICEIVKVDVLATGFELEPLVDRLAPFGVQLLAEKVEDRETHERCVKLGFELFQGFHFVRPESVVGRDLSPEALAVIRILNLLSDPHSSDRKLEEAFRTNPSLTYRLLRIVNSAAFGGRGIESIGHALRLLGRKALHRWMCLLLLASGRGGEMSIEMIRTSLVRARMAELVARVVRHAGAGSPDPDGLFLAGLLSFMDRILGVSMEVLLARLDLATPLEGALRAHEGVEGAILKAVVAHDEGRWSEAQSALVSLGCPVAIQQAYLDAVEWTRQSSGLEGLSAAA